MVADNLHHQIPPKLPFIRAVGGRGKPEIKRHQAHATLNRTPPARAAGKTGPGKSVKNKRRSWRPGNPGRFPPAGATPGNRGPWWPGNLSRWANLPGRPPYPPKTAQTAGGTG